MSTKKILNILILVFIGIAIGVGGFHVISQNEDFSKIIKIRAVGNNGETVFYQDDQYGYKLQHPKGFIVRKFTESGGAQTTVFQKLDSEENFQIYIKPYSKNTITGEQILFDLQSGVVDNLKEEDIAEGLVGATFYSQAQIVGRTVEIWFLHNRLLFEVTTQEKNEQLVREIIKTIEFTK